MNAHSPSRPIDTVREREFAALDGAAYLNAASLAPLPECARRTAEEYGLRRAAVQRMRGADFEPILAACRAAAARLVGATPDEIALGGNTSFGINLAALSLPLGERRTIVLSDREFPANVYPWMAREAEGARVEVIPATPAGQPDEARLLERLDRGDVGVFALSAVQFATGYRADLQRFGRHCRARGIHFVVDSIQALGHVPIDVEAMCIDVLAAGGHKWLCAPFGTGFAYVRRELGEGMAPRVVGWTAMRASAALEHVLDYRYEFLGDARKWEVATQPLQDFAAMTASLEMLLDVGIDEVERHVLSLLDPLAAWAETRGDDTLASDLSAGRRSGILGVRLAEPERVIAALQDADVHCALREGLVRISPHLYNTTHDMARLIDVLDSETSR
jgi:cysteine desulfurase / selenocysteine lyase